MNAIVKIRIMQTGWVLVMIPVLIQKIFVRKKGVDKNTKSANAIINFSISRKYSAMHGIMSSDEKTCVEKCLPDYSERK